MFSKGKIEDIYNFVLSLKKTDKYDNIRDTFEKLKTDQERVIYTFNIMWKNNFIPDATDKPKSIDESEKLRKEGNNVFARLCRNSSSALCREAMSLYTKSIALAPHTSRQLPLAYANRSAVLIELGLYSECIQDINRALNLKYPDDLKGKLYLRKAKCLILLKDHTAKNIIGKARYWINKMTQESKKLQLQAELDVLCQKIEQTNIQKDSAKLEKSESDLPVIRSFNKEVPCASDAVAIKYDAYNGRHVVATRDIDAGEVLVVEKPYSMLLLKTNILDHCSNCLRVCWATIPCKYCIYAMYCSEECRVIDWSKGHDVECTAFSILMNYNSYNTDLLSLRLAVLAVKEAGDIQGLRTMLKEADKNNDPRTVGFSSDGKFHSNKYISLYNLESNTEKRSFLELFQRAVRVCFILYALAKHTMFFGAKIPGDLRVLATNEDVTFLGGLILRNHQIISINAFDFNEVRNLDLVQRGVAVTAFCSLFNHSCCPNTYITSRPEHLVSYAVYPIKKGEQLLCVYDVHFIAKPKRLRQKDLLERYYFSCTCVACVGNWPICDKNTSSQAIFLSAKASDKEIIIDAFNKYTKYFLLAKVGDLIDKPYIIESLLSIIRMLHDRVLMCNSMLNMTAAALQIVYELHSNMFVVPTIQKLDMTSERVFLDSNIFLLVQSGASALAWL